MSTIIFGAGGQGRGFIRKQGVAPEDAQLTDNNKELWGTEVEGLLVVPPQQLRLSAADRVIITSSFAAEIHSQVTAAGVDKFRIFIPVKSLVTPKEALSDGIRALALQILSEVFQEVLDQEIPVFLDYGTLLGVWRDGAIPAHDGDVDLTVLTEPGETEAASTVARFFLRALRAEGCDAILTSDKDGNQSIVFTFRDSSCVVDINLLQCREGLVLWAESGATELVAQGDLLPLNEIHDPFRALVPNNTEAYLCALYGDDWETPIDDWPLSYGLSPSDFTTMVEWTSS